VAGQGREPSQKNNPVSPYGATIRDAVSFYLPHLKAQSRSCTASELVTELLGGIRPANAANVVTMASQWNLPVARRCGNVR